MSRKKNRKGSKLGKDDLFRSKTYYYGTTIGTGFWRRYKEGKLKDRDYGELWATRKGLFFRRYFTMEPIKISAHAIEDLSFGYGHAGKPALRTVLKVHWRSNDTLLVSGFASTKNTAEVLEWEKQIKKIMKG